MNPINNQCLSYIESPQLLKESNAPNYGFQSKKRDDQYQKLQQEANKADYPLFQGRIK